MRIRKKKKKRESKMWENGG